MEDFLKLLKFIWITIGIIWLLFINMARNDNPCELQENINKPECIEWR